MVGKWSFSLINFEQWSTSWGIELTSAVRWWADIDAKMCPDECMSKLHSPRSGYKSSGKLWSKPGFGRQLRLRASLLGSYYSYGRSEIHISTGESFSFYTQCEHLLTGLADWSRDLFDRTVSFCFTFTRALIRRIYFSCFSILMYIIRQITE